MPGADGQIIDEQRLGDIAIGPPLVEKKDGVRPAGDAMLLQPISGDLHQDRPILRAEEIAVRFSPSDWKGSENHLTEISGIESRPWITAWARARPVDDQVMLRISPKPCTAAFAEKGFDRDVADYVIDTASATSPIDP